MPAPVIIKKLNADHTGDSFTVFHPLNRKMVREIQAAVAFIFDRLGGASLLKSSREVYIKPNAVDAQAYSHTRVEVLEAVVRYWKAAGADRIYLFENATQANYTRLVFRAAGYRKMCRRNGVTPVYLDEENSQTLPFRKKAESSGGDGGAYDLPSFEMPETVLRLIRERDQHLYINVPKLKTHSMGVVTLGIKNQWGFPMHGSRGYDHNHLLHRKLVDILEYIQPDVTLIEGVEGTIHGHYFATALADEQVRPFKILIGSPNVFAADLAGAAVFGLGAEDVPHLQECLDRNLTQGVSSLADIDLAGDVTDLTNLDLIGDRPSSGAYPWDLHPAFPEDVRVIRGAEMACREGCVNNPLCGIQTMYLDHGGKGGWTLLIGKGHERSTLDSITGRVLIVGHCAIREAADRLISRLGRKNVYLSGECNNLCDTANALFHLMQVNPAGYVRGNPIVTMFDLAVARLKGSTSRVPSPLAHIRKLV